MATKPSRDYRNDPEWQARKAESERLALIAEEKERELSADEVPLVRSLAQAGFLVKSVWDLVSSPGPYKNAIPVLLEHLKKPYMERTREGIARALAVYDSADIWPELVHLYRNEPLFVKTGKNNGAKDGLALAVAQATTEENISTLIELARDRSNGSSRLLLLRRLRRSKNPIAKHALADLAADPDLEKEIASWKRRHNS